MLPKRIEPTGDQESVWDYPRPPRVEPSSDEVVVAFRGITLARSGRTQRVLETSQPPAYYVPRDDINMDLLRPSRTRSYCEWKGEAAYFDLEMDGETRKQVGWTYPNPTTGFEAITDHIAFYAQALDCTLDGEPVMANEGTFYGGWITSKVVGPFKGGAGSRGW